MPGDVLNIGGLLDFVSMALRLTIPLAFAALGGVVSERSGVYNIGLEGALLAGAFGAALGTFSFGDPFAGIIVGTLFGVAVGCLLALLTVAVGVNQFVSGIAINILVIGLTAFLSRMLFGVEANTTILPGFHPVRLPYIEESSVVARILAEQDWLAYALYGLVGLLSFIFRWTKLGLRIRAIGEGPWAAEIAGVAVNRIRFGCVVASCMLASWGGCYLVLSEVHVFSEHMSSGKGFVALAAIILGRWNPIGVFAACLLFGACEAAELRLQFQYPQIPYQLFAMLPYVASLFALWGLVGTNARSPAAVGVHYMAKSGDASYYP